MAAYYVSGDTYSFDNPNAPLTTCPRCGATYHLKEYRQVDTWNLGHYGCHSVEQCPSTHERFVDEGCERCKKELQDRLDNMREETIRKFWGR